MLRRAALLLVFAAALAGCAAPAATTLPYEVVWQDPGHAVLTIRNTGTEPLAVDAVLATMRATGPDGAVPMFWAGSDGEASICAFGEPTGTVPSADVRCAKEGFSTMPMRGDPLEPGGVVAYRFHALAYEDGSWGLMLTPDASVISDEMPMHKDGMHRAMTPGEYVFVVDGQRVPATL